MEKNARYEKSDQVRHTANKWAKLTIKCNVIALKWVQVGKFHYSIINVHLTVEANSSAYNDATWPHVCQRDVTWHLCGLCHLQNISDIQPCKGRKDRVQSPQHRWGLLSWIHRSSLHFIMDTTAKYLSLLLLVSVQQDGHSLARK